MIGLVLSLSSGCSLVALSYLNSEDESALPVVQVEPVRAVAITEPDLSAQQGVTDQGISGQSMADQSMAGQADEYLIGEMVVAVGAAIDAPEQPESLDTIAFYGTDTRYYVMIRGWLKQVLSGVQSQLEATRDRSTKDQLQQQHDFLQASIQRIDLE